MIVFISVFVPPLPCNNNKITNSVRNIDLIKTIDNGQQHLTPLYCFFFLTFIHVGVYFYF